MKRIGEVTPDDVREWTEEQRPYVLLDVREQGEWDAGHLESAVHIPLGSLEFYAPRLLLDQTVPVIVYCATGRRSFLACQTLQKLGYEDVYNLENGYLGYHGIL